MLVFLLVLLFRMPQVEYSVWFITEKMKDMMHHTFVRYIWYMMASIMCTMWYMVYDGICHLYHVVYMDIIASIMYTTLLYAYCFAGLTNTDTDHTIPWWHISCVPCGIWYMMAFAMCAMWYMVYHGICHVYHVVYGIS